MTDWPTPEEMVQARSILERVHQACPMDACDIGGSSVWEGLVEGKRMLTVSLQVAADVTGDEAYAKAWEEVLGA